MPVTLAASAGSEALREWPALVADASNRLYLVWEGVAPAGDGSARQEFARSRRSDDGGAHWTEPARIAAWDGYWDANVGASLAVTSDARGWLHAVWDYVGGASPGGTYYSVSSDHGANWSKPVSIGPRFHACAVAVDSANSRLYVGGAGVIGELPDCYDTAGDVRVQQRVSIPVAAHKPTLSFFYQLHKGTGGGGDRLQVLVDGQEAWSAPAPQNGWSHAWVDLERWRGSAVTLAFNLSCVLDGDRAEALLDDVSLGSWLTPVIRSVSPARVEAGAAVTLTIEGENLLPGTLQLGSTVVTDVQVVDEQTLRVALPATWWPGIYDVRVVNQGGQEGVLLRGLRWGREQYLPVIRKQ